MGKIVALVMVLFMMIIGLTFVAELQPVLGNVTYKGGGIGDVIFGLAQDWVPVIAIVGLLFYGFKKLIGQ